MYAWHLASAGALVGGVALLVLAGNRRALGGSAHELLSLDALDRGGVVRGRAPPPGRAPRLSPPFVFVGGSGPVLFPAGRPLGPRAGGGEDRPVDPPPLVALQRPPAQDPRNAPGRPPLLKAPVRRA